MVEIYNVVEEKDENSHVIYIVQEYLERTLVDEIKDGILSKKEKCPGTEIKEGCPWWSDSGERSPILTYEQQALGGCEKCGGGNGMLPLTQGQLYKWEKDVAIIACQICEALSDLHTRGIMHKDIKLENIMMDANKNLKLIDFGLADDKPCTGNSREGTPGYAAPETKSGSVHVTNSNSYYTEVDVFSMGITIFALLGGLKSQPDISETLKQLQDKRNVFSLLDKTKDSELKFWKNLSREARDFVQRCCATYRTERPSLNVMMKHPWITRQKMEGLEVCKGTKKKPHKPFFE